MVYPMTRIRNIMQLNLPKVLQCVVLPGPILQTVQRIDQQSRRLNAAPQLDNLIDCQPDVEKVVGVLIVLPRELPVLAAPPHAG